MSRGRLGVAWGPRAQRGVDGWGFWSASVAVESLVGRLGGGCVDIPVAKQAPALFCSLIFVCVFSWDVTICTFLDASCPLRVVFSVRLKQS